jgi:hypothetical protein
MASRPLTPDEVMAATNGRVSAIKAAAMTERHKRTSGPGSAFSTSGGQRGKLTGDFTLNSCQRLGQQFSNGQVSKGAAKHIIDCGVETGPTPTSSAPMTP